jgi:hypothetical protein
MARRFINEKKRRLGKYTAGKLVQLQWLRRQISCDFQTDTQLANTITFIALKT